MRLLVLFIAAWALLAAPANAQINSTAPSTATPASPTGSVQLNAGGGFFGSISLAGTDAKVATTPGGAVAGNFTKFDSNGGVVDSGVPCCAGTGVSFFGPTPITGRAYPFWGTGGNQSGAAAQANYTIACYPAYVPTTRTISQLGLYLTTQVTSGGGYVSGIYDSTGTNNGPGSLLVTTGNISESGSTPQVRYGTLTANWQMQANVLYWICTQNSDTTAIVSAVYSAGTIAPNILGVSSGNEQFLSQSGKALTGYTCNVTNCTGSTMTSLSLPASLSGATWTLNSGAYIPFVIHVVVSSP